jgi:hypothetical protein
LPKWIFSVSFAILVICCGNEQSVNADTTASQSSQYKWLLAYIGRTTNELMRDKRVQHVLDNVIPPKQTTCVAGREKPLRVVFRKMLTDAPDFVTMRDNRYIAFSGHDVIHPEDKALVWLDWRDGRSAIAIIHHWGPDDSKQYSKEPLLWIASVTFHGTEPLPPELTFAIKNWVVLEGITPAAITYNGAPAGASLVF